DKDFSGPAQSERRSDVFKGDRRHDVAVATRNPRRFRARCFIREKEFFSDMEPISKTRGAHSTGVPKSINTLRKFSQCAGDPDSELWSPASAPERTRMPWRRAPTVRVRVT